MDIFVYLSDILGNVFVDANGKVLGRLCDGSLKVSEEVYPRVDAFLIERGFVKKEYAHIPIEDIESFDHSFTLKVSASKVRYRKTRLKYNFSLCRDILDQQVVDIDDLKVVRVNDVHLLRVYTQFYLAHVDVGLRGLVRRLGWTRGIDAIVRYFSPQSLYLTQEDFIPWKNTQALTLGPSKNVLRIDVGRKKLSQIPPAALAEIMEDLDIFEKYSIFCSLDEQLQRKVFSDLSTSEKEELVDQMKDREAVTLLENIPADEATDLLMSLPRDKTLQLMRGMETKTSKKLRKLLGFAKDSAGGLMTTEYLSLSSTATVEDALNLIKANVNYPGNIINIHIVDNNNRLLGVTSLRYFINADPATPIVDTCQVQRVFVRTDDGMEEVALLLEKYKFSSIPVLSDDDILQGVITSDDVMEELISIAWAKYKDKLE